MAASCIFCTPTLRSGQHQRPGVAGQAATALTRKRRAAESRDRRRINLGLPPPGIDSRDAERSSGQDRGH